MTVTLAVVSCVPASIGVPLSEAAAFANIGIGRGAAALDHRRHLAERAAGCGGERLGAQAGIGHRRLERLPVERSLVGDRHRRAVHLVRARLDGGVDQRPRPCRGRSSPMTTFEAAKPVGSPFWPKTWESETDCVPTLRPPADLTAAITWRISRALAAIAAFAVAARTSTPNEKDGRGRDAADRAVAGDRDRVARRGRRAVDGVRALGPGDAGDGSGGEQERRRQGRCVSSDSSGGRVSSTLRGCYAAAVPPLAYDHTCGDRALRTFRRATTRARVEARPRLGERLADAARPGRPARGDALRRRAGRHERPVAHARRDALVRLAERHAVARRAPRRRRSRARAGPRPPPPCARGRPRARRRAPPGRRSPSRVSARAAKTGALSSCRSRS